MNFEVLADVPKALSALTYSPVTQCCLNHHWALGYEDWELLEGRSTFKADTEWWTSYKSPYNSSIAFRLDKPWASLFYFFVLYLSSKRLTLRTVMVLRLYIHQLLYSYVVWTNNLKVKSHMVHRMLGKPLL